MAIEKYGCVWKTNSHLSIEMSCIKKGGIWKQGNKECGLGLLQHYINMERLIWPSECVHRWKKLVLGEMVRQRILALIGAASTGKSHEAALYALCTYYVFPNETTVLCSSTTRELLEMRIFGELKKHHQMAQQRYPELPGKLLESRQRIITTDEELDGRDFRNGIAGVACRVGGNYRGLGDYIGIKNKRVILVADELQFMEGNFIDSFANLNKNPIFQGFGLGNPKDRTDALGKLAEPSDEEGGWDALDDTEITKTWKTRWNDGLCIQLVGTDSPNFDVPEGDPIPFPFLISRRSIDDDAQFYGRESMQFAMMDLGMMPKDVVARRVITRSMCIKFQAMEEVIWSGEKLTRLAGMDAAYSGVGGDRSTFIPLAFGQDRDGNLKLAQTAPASILQVKPNGGLPEEQLATQARELCTNYDIPPEHLFFDSTGRGSLALAFARLWSSAVVGIEFGGVPTDRLVADGIIDTKTKRPKTCRENYDKFVTELWFSARLLIMADMMRQLQEEIMAEGCMREWGFKGDVNKISVEPKEKTKIRMGRSPDLFDGYVSGIEGARRLGFKITKVSNQGLGANDRKWLDDLRKQAHRLNQHRQLTYR